MAYLIWVNGVKIKTPSSFTWGQQDISSSDAGRVQEKDLMYKLRTSQKRQLSLGWNGTTPSETATILKAFNSEYFYVTYPDSLSGQDETREFYRGDVTTPVKTWMNNKKLYTSVTFDVIER